MLKRGQLLSVGQQDDGWLVVRVERRRVVAVCLTYHHTVRWEMCDDGIRASLFVTPREGYHLEPSATSAEAVPVTRVPPPAEVAAYLRGNR